jgi:hypothetical protein
VLDDWIVVRPTLCKLVAGLDALAVPATLVGIGLGPLGSPASRPLAAVFVPPERADVLIAAAAPVHLHVEGLAALHDRHQLVPLSARHASTSERRNLRLPNGVVNDGSGRSPRGRVYRGSTYLSIVFVEQRHMRARSHFVSSGSKSARLGNRTI